MLVKDAYHIDDIAWVRMKRKPRLRRRGDISPLSPPLCYGIHHLERRHSKFKSVANEGRPKRRFSIRRVSYKTTAVEKEKGGTHIHIST